MILTTFIILLIFVIYTNVYQVYHLYNAKDKFVKITNVFVSTVARNNLNCNLISHLKIVISISLCCLIDVQKVEYLF